MQSKQLLKFYVFFLFFLLTFFTHASIPIEGIVLDEVGETLIGANITIKGQESIGTITDYDGKFDLEVNLPVTLVISYIGYLEQELTLTEYQGKPIEVRLSGGVQLDQIVVGASRVEERIVEAPTTIEKINAVDLKNSSAGDFYETLTKLKGVQANKGSMVFTSYNTRGFAETNNLRFLQHIDGMDITTPGLTVIGNTAGVSVLDVQSIEVIPGANSALYGADAFNGLLRIYTKSPFDFPGLSFQVKTGLTSQNSIGNNTYNDISLRIAKPLSEKFAIKLNVNLLNSNDWDSDDQRWRMRQGSWWAASWAERDNLSNKQFGDPDYNGSSKYGDGDFGIGVVGRAGVNGVNLDGNGDGDFDDSVDAKDISLFRSGFHDEDLWDNKIRNYRINASLHYKLSDKYELTYLFKRSLSDFAFRTTTFYPFENFVQQHHKLELKSKKLTARIYRASNSTNGVWIGGVAAGRIEPLLKSNDAWLADYQTEYTRSGGNHAAARTFADREYLDANGKLLASAKDLFKATRASITANPDVASGGGGFVDNSAFTHADVKLDFTDDLPFSLIAGANVRAYTIDSNGFLFNDGKVGKDEGGINNYNPFHIIQYGIFSQISKKFLQERLKLTGSLRFDGHEIYASNLTPRLGAVYALGPKKDHNIRASYQTGFRNPGLQESYIAFDFFPNVTILGGSQLNLDNYTYTGPSGQVYYGTDIKQNLSLGGAALPTPASLVPEKNRTFEIGYKSLINNKVFIDAYYYFTSYDNFVVRNTVFHIPNDPSDLRVFLWWQNSSDKVTSQGAGFSIDWLLGKGFKVGGNYSYASHDVVLAGTEVSLEDADFAKVAKRFNTPKDRINLTFSNNGFGKDKRWGVDLVWHFTNEYFYSGAFGQAIIPAYNWTDVAVFYKLPKINGLVKLGAANAFRQEYTHIYNGGSIGGLYTLTFRMEGIKL